MFDEFAEFRATNTVGTVNRHRPLELAPLHGGLEGCCQLLTITLLSGFAVLVKATFGINASGKVVQLRRSQNLVIGRICTSGIQRFDKRRNEMWSRSSSIPSVDDPRFRLGLDPQFVGKSLVSLDQSLIVYSISESGGMCLPRRLNV